MENQVKELTNRNVAIQQEIENNEKEKPKPKAQQRMHILKRGRRITEKVTKPPDRIKQKAKVPKWMSRQRKK